MRAFLLALIFLLPVAARAAPVPAASSVVIKPGPATPEEIYTIRNVKVDEHAESTAAARDTALATARRDAFQRLLRRIVLPQERPRLRVPSDDELIDLVSSFEVVEEKSSSKRYLANLTLRFSPEKVRALLLGANIPHSEIGGKPVLLIPVYDDPAGQLLWEPANPWRDALSKAIVDSGSDGDRLLPLYLPQGDAGDAMALNAQQAVLGDPQRLSVLQRRYGVRDILLLHAKASGGGAIDVTVRPLGSGSEEVRIERFEGSPGEAPAQILHRAATRLVADLQDDWMQQSAVDAAQEASLEFLTPLASLNDWVALQRRLSDVPIIRKIDVVAMSVGNAQIKLHYWGTPEKLVAALRHVQLDLVQEAGHWTLRQVGP